MRHNGPPFLFGGAIELLYKQKLEKLALHFERLCCMAIRLGSTAAKPRQHSSSAAYGSAALVKLFYFLTN